MLSDIAQRLDDWIVARNVDSLAEGLPAVGRCEIKVLGQMALLEGGADLPLVATHDVDVVADYPHSVEQEFRRLLAARGLELDPVGREVWMPHDTNYAPIFIGRFVTLSVAEVEAVLVSKALKAPLRNRQLIVAYLAKGASVRFFALAEIHGLDLESFL
jgi:hypothetical protein